MTSQRRRLERVSATAEGDWLRAWDRWLLRIVRLWRRCDPRGREHHALVVPLEQRWASLVSAEQVAEFLEWGELRAAELGAPEGVWTWFWREAYGCRLRADLRVWPQTLPSPPQVSEGQLRRLVDHILSDPSDPVDPGLTWAVVLALLGAVATLG